jgi:hypothetical protein
VNVGRSTGTIIGGSDADDGALDGNVGARNVISGNSDGINSVPGGEAFSASITIQGNLIGVNATGNAALGNFQNGILAQIQGPAGNLIIGGTTVGAGNVISGNASDGIIGMAQQMTVQGNRVGTDLAGTLDLGNGFEGILVQLTSFPGPALAVLVGGTTTEARNIVSGNGGDGIRVDGSLVQQTGALQGNFIGTRADGTTALPNGGNGVDLRRSATVGGANPDEGNVVAFNGGRGVNLNFPQNSPILGNSIFANGPSGVGNQNGLGIDIFGDGVTPNDLNDGDTGLNNLQNFPVLTSAVTGGGSTTIQGTLNSLANTTFRVEFFSNPTCDPSGNGEGRTFLGSTSVITVGNNAAINVALPVAVTAGQFVTLTATDPLGNTSEFSACVSASAAPSGDPCPGPTPNITLANVGANGYVYCGVTSALNAPVLRAPGVVHDSATAIFSWSNPDQQFKFWFRGFPNNFQTLTTISPGSYYFFQSTGAGTIANTGGGATLALSGSANFQTVAGANGHIWSGGPHATNTLGGYGSITPVTAIFSWNNGAQQFNFWFRGFPDNFQTLTPGIERGKYYFFQSPGGQVIPMD